MYNTIKHEYIGTLKSRLGGKYFTRFHSYNSQTQNFNYYILHNIMHIMMRVHTMSYLYNIFYCSAVYWNTTALINTYARVYFNHFVNSFGYNILFILLYMRASTHIFRDLPSLASVLIHCGPAGNTHFYIIPFNIIIIIVFVNDISPKSNSFRPLRIYYYKLLSFKITFIMCWPSSHLVVPIYHPFIAFPVSISLWRG